MENVCRVHSLESSECLVDEVLAVIIRQVLSANNTVHVSLHKFLCDVRKVTSDNPHITVDESWVETYLDEIDFSEGLIAPWLLDIKN